MFETDYYKYKVVQRTDSPADITDVTNNFSSIDADIHRVEAGLSTLKNTITSRVNEIDSKYSTDIATLDSREENHNNSVVARIQKLETRLWTLTPDEDASDDTLTSIVDESEIDNWFNTGGATE